MPYVSSSVTSTFYVKNASTGVVVSGLLNANFTVSAYVDGLPFAISATVTEVAGGVYKIAYTNPSSPGTLDIYIAPSNSAYVIEWPAGSTYVGTFDEDRLGGLVVRPRVALDSGLQLGAEAEMQLAAYRYRELSVPIVDENGDVLPLNGYSNFAVAVRSVNGEGAVYQAGHSQAGWSITGDVNGNLAFNVPADLGFTTDTDAWAALTAYSLHNVRRPSTLGSLIFCCIVAGTSGATEPDWPDTPGETVTDGTVTWMACNDFFSLLEAGDLVHRDLTYEFVAFQAADSAKPVTLLRGPLTLSRTEVQL